MQANQITGGHIDFVVNLDTSCVHAVFFFHVTATTEISTLSLHHALPIYNSDGFVAAGISYRGVLGFLEDLRLPKTDTYTLMIRDYGADQTLGYKVSFIKLT